MADEICLPPSATCLSQSLRDLGYSIETAIADLIDNSITAESSEIRIFCKPDESTEDFILAIVDNGEGMTGDTLKNAMRFGSTNPRTDRSDTDLGRFGLGLKTATFSQCRKLTVLSSDGTQRSAAEWDLNLIDEKDDWIVRILDSNEIDQIPYANEINRSGTLVLWSDLDRLTEQRGGTSVSKIIYDKLDEVERHLTLVFHRFLSGEIEGRKPLSIFLNHHKLKPFDPFCRKNSGTRTMPEEKFRIENRNVRMQPYILPHHSKLSKAEYEFYQDRSDFLSNQGAYIYRNGRLMAWGDWFRLVAKGENTKLARVQIDFPSALDHIWTIDIKKSRAYPPSEVRKRLKRIIGKIATSSIEVSKGRGKKIYEKKYSVWSRFADRGIIRYEINRKHPIIKSILKNLNSEQKNQFDTILHTISASLPIEMIYSDYSANPKEYATNTYTQSELIKKLEELDSLLFQDCLFDQSYFEQISQSTGLFEGRQNLIEKYIEEKSNE